MVLTEEVNSENIIKKKLVWTSLKNRKFVKIIQWLKC